MTEPIKIGIGGPVGAGKTQLVERLTRHMSREISMAAITNDIYTIEDAKILAANGILPEDRIIGVETGGCPHTAIREDTSMNTAAIEELKARHPDLQVIFVESGGDNLSATFSPELVDFSIYIIDVAQGEKIPRKAGQGMIKSDLFIINKTDLAPHVGADLSVMERDSREFRGTKPFCFTNLKTDEGLDAVIEWVRRDVLMLDLAHMSTTAVSRAHRFGAVSDGSAGFGAVPASRCPPRRGPQIRPAASARESLAEGLSCASVNARGRSIASQQFHEGALRVLRPHYLDDSGQVCYVLVNPGGAYLGADLFLVDVEVQAGASICS